MKTLLKYNTKEYKINQDKFNPLMTAKTESMMALGNGYLGLRSVDEEISSFNKEDLFVNGVFNKENIDEVSELANLSDSIQTKIMIDGIEFQIAKTDKYFKEISLSTGELFRQVIAKRGSKEFKLTFTRFVSQVKKNIYGQKIVVEQTKGATSKITVFPKINGQTTNSGAQHFKEGAKKRPTPTTVRYIEETTLSGRHIIHNLVTKAMSGKTVLKGGNDDYVITMGRRQVGFKINSVLSTTKPFTIEKIMSVNTSIDNAKGSISANAVLKRADVLLGILLKTNYTKEFNASKKSWKAIYDQFFIEIKGDSEDAKYDSLAIKFGIFHVNSFVPTENPHLSVGAKGLSGEGYQGHSFWDTEFFINPNYLFTKPQVARNLLEYRYKGIEGARTKAAEKKVRSEESNLKGAQYPWEMAWPADGEVCPYWGQADVVTGIQEPIASRRQEIHVPADVAYAVHQYFVFTKDEKFMKEMGYEMIIDTAIFWSNRAEKKGKKYEINDVMGPNEYKGNINNNAYTNAFAKLNLDLALIYIDRLSKTAAGKKTLEAVTNKIPYPINIKKLKDVATNLVQQVPNEKGIIAENDQFLGLNRIDVKPFQLLGDAGKKLFSTEEGHKRLSSQLVKQADVVLLTQLLPHKFDKNVIKKNFDFYEPITTHDSSLSPTSYAIQAIELRQMDLAYKLYKYSLNIDMGPNMDSCNTGIHAGALAAIWQSTIFGYGGMRWFNDELHIDPILPKTWDGLKFRAKYQKVEFEVSVGKKDFTVKTLTRDKKLSVIINGKKIVISNKLTKLKINIKGVRYD